MSSSIIIKRLQLSARCGVTESERRHPQPLLVDLQFRCPNHPAFQSDRLSDTVDYGAVIGRIRDIAETQPYALLETLTEAICHTLFKEFPISHLKVWVRKIQPPLDSIQGSVGVQVNRTRPHDRATGHSPPTPFMLSHGSRLPRGTVLDVAAGQGRHALYLASQGCSVHAIDRDAGALQELENQAHHTGIRTLTTSCLDLETDDAHPPDLGTEAYEAIIVFFYLYRPLFPRLIQALKPGGILMYETFLLDNHLQRQHPRRKEFCFQDNELLTLLRGLKILHYDEGDHEGPSGKTGAFTVRALAQKCKA